MRSLPTPALPFAAPRQLSMPFESGSLRGISPSDRRMAPARLTRLLLEAAGVWTEERDDDHLPAAVLKRKAVVYAKRTLIFVIEDDAQDGPDHVDAQRTIGYIIGPYVKRRGLVSTRYSTVNMVRTIEDILGLQPLGLQDGLSEPMADALDLQRTAFSCRPATPRIGRRRWPVRTSPHSTASRRRSSTRRCGRA